MTESKLTNKIKHTHTTHRERQRQRHREREREIGNLYLHTSHKLKI